MLQGIARYRKKSPKENAINLFFSDWSYSSSEVSARKSLNGQGSSLIELASSTPHWARAHDPNFSREPSLLVCRLFSDLVLVNGLILRPEPAMSISQQSFSFRLDPATLMDVAFS